MPTAYVNNRTAQEWQANRPLALLRRGCFAVLTLTMVLCAPMAAAADNSGLPNARAVYQNDRAMCNSGQTNQDRTTCLKEAGAAYDQTRRGQLNDGQTSYQQNAMARCNALPPEDMKACQRRMMGEGYSEGSAQEGGIYRRIETRQ